MKFFNRYVGRTVWRFFVNNNLKGLTMAVKGKPRRTVTRADKARKIQENSLIENKPYTLIGDEPCYYCSCCGKSYKNSHSNFYKSPHPFYRARGGRITVCKTCIEHYFAEYEQMLGNSPYEAIKHLGTLFGYYVGDNVVNSASKGGAVTLFGSLSKTCGMQMGLTYDNYIVEQREKPEILSEECKIEKLNKVTDKVRKFWGGGFSDEDYIFLNDKYIDWTQRHECKTKAQESIFQKICLMELQITSAIQSGDDKAVASAMKAFNDLLGSANIKPVQNKDNALADQNTFGTLIQKWENEEPIPEPDPEWKDVDGIGKYVKTWFKGHLCKMLGIKNSFSDVYDEEIAKHTVNKPEYEDDVDLSYDAIFGKKDDAEGGENIAEVE